MIASASVCLCRALWVADHPRLIYNQVLNVVLRKGEKMARSCVATDIGGDSPGSISSTLLVRVKMRQADAWQRLVDLYGPTVFRRCRAASVPIDHIADVVQEVFASVAAHVDAFHREKPRDSFSAWLRTITRNKIRDYFRRIGAVGARGGTDAHQRLLQLPELPDPPEPSGLSERASIVHRATDLVKAEFESRTWEAFWRTAVNAETPADVAADLGLSTQAVYKAKSRVLRRLRQELGGLWE
jgi:RNA polymerase sigma-70 factor (ECF subfamily)